MKNNRLTTTVKGKPFTVFIAADIEGATGYVQWPEKPPEDSWCREQMTVEVNAAIEGALEGGAKEVIVSDIHWRKQNIIPDRLAGNASLIRGTKRKLMWMDFVERSDLVFLVGFHAGAGFSDAVLPHTIDTRIIGIKINGRVADEALISAATAGYFNIPVGLVSGDIVFIEEVKKILKEVEIVAVKEGVGNFAALNLHPGISTEAIKQAAEKAVRRGLKGEFKPYPTGERVEVEVEVNWPAYADALCLIPGVKRHGGRTVSFSGDWLEALGIISLFVNWVVTIPGIL
jgi:D-amino peptidase